MSRKRLLFPLLGLLSFSLCIDSIAVDASARGKADRARAARRAKAKKHRKQEEAAPEPPPAPAPPAPVERVLPEDPSHPRSIMVPAALPRPKPKTPAVRRAPPPKPYIRSAGEQLLAQSLTLRVSQRTDKARWRIHVVNQGPTTVVTATDPRLLWFEATVPGRKGAFSCRLPQAMLPPNLGAAQPTTLTPGSGFSFHVDPRMYCFTEGDQTILVPGAQLRPYYGWPERSAVAYKGGKPETIKLKPEAPYVARLLQPFSGPLPRTEPSSLVAPPKAKTPPGGISSAPSTPVAKTDSENDSAPADSVDGGDSPDVALNLENGAPADSVSADTYPGVPNLATLPKPGLRRVEGEGFALDSSYIEWAHARIRPHSAGGPESEQSSTPNPLELEITTGKDAANFRDLTVTVRLRNTGDEAVRVRFQRHLLSFSVMGPRGQNSCDPNEAALAPSDAGMITLKAHQQQSLVTRLAEFCDAEVFREAGFYYVSAHLWALPDSDDETQAVSGVLQSSAPRPMRLQTGEFPFLTRRAPTFTARPGSASNQPAPVHTAVAAPGAAVAPAAAAAGPGAAAPGAAAPAVQQQIQAVMPAPQAAPPPATPVPAPAPAPAQ